MKLLFIISLILFSIFSYAFVDLNLPYLHFFYTGLYLYQRIGLSLVYFVLVSILFFCFYRFINKRLEINRNVKNFVFFVILASVFAYPAVLSFDIFNYITTAKVAYFYHENPYVIYPIEFINEPYLAFTRAANKTALYGPAWLLLSAIPFFLGFGNFILTLISFKLFIAMFFAGTLYIIYKIERNAVPFFALNPLVIIETLVSGHNDIVMIFFALLAFYWISTKRASSVSLFIVSTMIKFATIVLIPIYLMAFLKRLEKEKIFSIAAVSMFVIFLLSPLREELYPWYAIWFIAFTCFLHKNRFLQNLILFFSLGLMLRYIPYMGTGNYFGLTPIIRITLTILPLVLFLISEGFKKRFKFI